MGEQLRVPKFKKGDTIYTKVGVEGFIYKYKVSNINPFGDVITYSLMDLNPVLAGGDTNKYYTKIHKFISERELRFYNILEVKDIEDD